MKRLKALIGLWLCLILMCCAGGALAGNLTITDSADVLEEAAQFPFFAETDELAVNVRKETNTKSAKVARLERGMQLVVTSAQVNSSGEIWYAVEMNDGTTGYIRSDLLKKVEEETAPLMAVLEQEDTFSAFKAKTTQSAVNVRVEADSKSSKAGQVSRGQIMTVVAQVINNAGEKWYAVKLSDGTEGYIRSDLLIETDETENEQITTSKTTTSQKKTTSSSGSGQYIGNKSSKKFHRSSCRSLHKESNRKYFPSRDKAISSGYVPCKICNP